MAALATQLGEKLLSIKKEATLTGWLTWRKDRWVDRYEVELGVHGREGGEQLIRVTTEQPHQADCTATVHDVFVTVEHQCPEDVGEQPNRGIWTIASYHYRRGPGAPAVLAAPEVNRLAVLAARRELGEQVVEAEGDLRFCNNFPKTTRRCFSDCANLSPDERIDSNAEPSGRAAAVCWADSSGPRRHGRGNGHIGRRLGERQTVPEPHTRRADMCGAEQEARHAAEHMGRVAELFRQSSST